jgi:zinc protease
LKFSPLERTVSFKLSNGLQVYLKPDRRAPLVSAQAWVRVGSVDESENEAGLSHVLEHMLFKGTEHYRAEEISRWIEALGGSLNAETSREYTRYYIDVPAHGAQEAVTLLSELLYRATFDPLEWARECPVILEEMKRRNDDPESVLWDVFNEVLYKNTRLRQPVIGYPRTVEAVTPEILRRFYERHYRAERAVLVIAGHFKTPEMRRWVERAFAGMPSAGAAREPFPAEKSFEPSTQKRNRPVHQSYVAFGFPTPSSDHEDQEALDLLAAVLSDGRGSRLVDRLRETKKLVWSVNAFNLTHSGPGLFGILFECDAPRRDAATEELYRVLRSLKRRAPIDYELRRAKNLIQTSWLQGYETYHHQAATIGSFAIDGNLQRLKNYLPRLLSIKTPELNAVIEKYFGEFRLSSAVIEAP